MQLELTNDEALVLFKFLHRAYEMDDYSIKDGAEQQVLRTLECQLEKALLEPCFPNYFEIVKQARNRIRWSEE